MSKTRVCLACFLFIMTCNVVWGQFGGRNRIRQNLDVPQTEFIFARWQYESSSGWNHDYPAAEEHINQIMSEATGVSVDQMSYKIVPIASDEIFQYPFAYVSEPGMMYLSEEEVQYFREYVDRGGFVMLDDFDGERMFQIMADNMKRVFPDREMFRMENEHPILNTYYKIDRLYISSPYAVGGDAEFFGIKDEDGRLSVIICYNNDVGDYWEYIDQPAYPVRPSAEALRLGINFVIYAMTH